MIGVSQIAVGGMMGGSVATDGPAESHMLGNEEQVVISQLMRSL